LELAPRARQNVIFELGFFYGKLGRKKVCAILKEGVEFPSDISGVIYKTADATGAWKLELAKEMKAAGLDVDLNKLG
jgi:predicted nucleotide-binding protein